MIKEKYKFIERSTNKFLQIAKDFIEVCPKCKSKEIYNRTRKTPKYRCQNCGDEFDDPKAMIVNKTTKQKNDYGKQYYNSDE